MQNYKKSIEKLLRRLLLSSNEKRKCGTSKILPLSVYTQLSSVEDAKFGFMYRFVKKKRVASKSRAAGLLTVLKSLA